MRMAAALLAAMVSVTLPALAGLTALAAAEDQTVSDFAGNRRLRGAHIDIGAFEAVPGAGFVISIR